MLSTSRSRVRALAVVSLAVVVTATIGTVAYNASAAEVSAPAAPAAFGPDAYPVSTPWIPAAIQPPAGSHPIGTYVVAQGTQNYTCGSDGTAGVYGKAVPEAQLVGTGGRIHHFGGPSWQSESDSSLVTAKKLGDSPRAGAIPELLLQVTSHAGQGILDKADYISRLQTSGGVAPASCQADEKASVPYHAVYIFWDAPSA
jgi:hypothetical protein